MCVVTSQVFDEVLQLHLPLGFDVGAVHVSVEEDDGERQDEDGVRIPELPHHRGVADAVALAGGGGKGESFHTQQVAARSYCKYYSTMASLLFLWSTFVVSGGLCQHHV